MKEKKGLLVACLICIFICLALHGKCGADEVKLKRLSSKEIKTLECQADGARNCFFDHNYCDAIDQYKGLTNDLTVSKPLYLCELGICQMGEGHLEDAHNTLLQAANMLEVFYDESSEKSAVGYFGAENKKVFKGDPYERSMLSLFLGLLFLESSDVDNALACFKNGIMCDSDIANEMFKSDFTLLYALEAKCYKERGQIELYEQSRAQAEKAFKLTHPQIRDLVNQKQAMLNIGANPKAPVQESDGFDNEFGDEDEIEAPSEPENKSQEPELDLAEIDYQIEEVMTQIDTGYIAPLMESDYNTLLVIWSGAGPSKKRVGQYGEKSVFVLNPPNDNRYEIKIADCDYMDAIQGTCNVSFQATTRGGRLMDNVLQSQADFKAFSSGLGNVLLDSANDVGGYAGLAMLLVGAIAKGISAATNPEADIRHWVILPNSLQFLPLTLAPGNYEGVVEEFNDFIKVGERFVSFGVDDDKLVNLFVIMPNSDI